MRAMQLDQPLPAEQSPLQLRELPTPTPAANQVRVKVRCCGLCHTDLHTIEGDLPLPKSPVVPGHQIVGFIDEIGKDVHTLKEGDRVGIPWLHQTDGTCDYCRRGLENLCDNARFTGYHTDGGYADYALVSEDFAHPLPSSFTDENAAPLLCAGIIGYRSYRLSEIRRGQRLGLFGFGASAHLVLQLARYQGCEVYVFTRAEAHRQLAKKLGAAWVGGAEDEAPAKLDAAIIFAPAGALVPAALKKLRKGGTLALAGITMSAIPQMDYSLLYHERVIRTVANSTRQDCREFLELAAEANLQTEIKIYTLENANLALQDLKHSRIEGAGVLRL
jgi:alcohol dehydrogenase, propanol-preferring